MNDKISIIMGIYNCADTLQESIESILAQTYANWELIMCEDCSTDNTYEIAKSYQLKYPDKIVLLKNEVNSKLAFSLNHCLKYATGTYVARMDGDDISHPERFKKQVMFLKNNPHIDLVGTYMQRFNNNGYAEIVKAPLKPDRYTLKDTVPFFHATIMTYKRVYDVLNGYTVSELTSRAEDYDLWFRFFKEGFNGETIDEPLYFVREDENAIRRRTIRSRWRAFKIARRGFALLNYPKWWIVKYFYVTLFKSIVPIHFISLYRNLKNKKIEENK